MRMKPAPLALLGFLVCVPVAAAQTPAAKQATVAYLQALQAADGGFLPAKTEPAGKSSMRTTVSAVRAVRFFGGEPRNLAKAVTFLKSCYDPKTGGFADRPGGMPDVATTAIGLIGVAELGLPVAEYAPAMRYLNDHVKGFDDIRIAAAAVEATKIQPPQTAAWLGEIGKLRNPDGTYGKGAGTARATGGATAAVLRLDGVVVNRDRVIQAILRGQRADGGFGKEDTTTSDLESSYRIVRCLHMLKQKPDASALRDFIARCRNADGGYGVVPGQASSVSGTYYAGIILHWLED